MGTKDHALSLFAIPLDADRSLIHFRFSHGYGLVSRMAMYSYLLTLGRTKVGFSVVGEDGDGMPLRVRGEQGVIERNAVRYHLAIQAYLETLELPASLRFESRLSRWYDLTDAYPEQLHEMEKREYLGYKRRESVDQARLQSELLKQVRGSGGTFDGIPVADLSAGSRGLARDVIASILDNYQKDDVGYAWECVERNGGIDAFHLADYDQDHQGGRVAGDGPSQIFRLESPAAVFYYRGEPHLHAFFNVAMDGERPLSLGEPLGTNPSELGSRGVKAMFEAALLDSTDADFAYYPLVSVAGRLRAGEIRAGDLYNLESWKDDVAVMEISGAVGGAGPLRPRGRRARLERGRAVDEAPRPG